MLIKHLISIFQNISLTKEQKQQFIDLLMSIKENPSLLSEFHSVDSKTLRENIQSNTDVFPDNDTFFDLSISIIDDEGIESESTYAELEFDLIEEIVSIQNNEMDNDTFPPNT